MSDKLGGVTMQEKLEEDSKKVMGLLVEAMNKLKPEADPKEANLARRLADCINNIRAAVHLAGSKPLEVKYFLDAKDFMRDGYAFLYAMSWTDPGEVPKVAKLPEVEPVETEEGEGVEWVTDASPDINMDPVTGDED